MGQTTPKSPLTLEARGLPSNTWMIGVTPLTILNDSSIAARISAELCNKVTWLGTPSHTCDVRMSPSSNRTCGMWPPNSPDLNPVNYGMPFGWSCSCRSACTKVESLKIWNNWSRRLCWSGAHCHRGSLMAVSTIVEASPSGCLTGEWWTYWTEVQLAVDICTL